MQDLSIQFYMMESDPEPEENEMTKLFGSKLEFEAWFQFKISVSRFI